MSEEKTDPRSEAAASSTGSSRSSLGIAIAGFLLLALLIVTNMNC